MNLLQLEPRLLQRALYVIQSALEAGKSTASSYTKYLHCGCNIIADL